MVEDSERLVSIWPQSILVGLHQMGQSNSTKRGEIAQIAAKNMDNIANVLLILVMPFIFAATIRTWWLAAVLCAIVLTIVVHAITYASLGYVDAFWRLSLVIAFATFLAWSSLVALFYRFVRRRRAKAD